MRGKPEVIAGFQAVASAAWSLATECHVMKKALKHKDLKGPGHGVGRLGESAEEWMEEAVKQIFFLGGKPVIQTDTVTDDYATIADLFERLLTKVRGTDGNGGFWGILNDMYFQFVSLKDADSAHDVKDMIHQLEKHTLWLEKQLDNCTELGEIAYRTAKIV